MPSHNAMTGGELHEPKAIAAAAKGTAYMADGAGSGVFTIPTGANTVIVNSLADFPTPSGGKHTLAANTNYVLAAAVTTSDYFEVSDGTSITANNLFAPLLTYSGTGSMFVGVDAQFLCRDIHMTCPTANVFDISESGAGGTKRFQAESVIVDACVQWGTFDKLRAVLINNSSGISATSGIIVTGSVTLILSIQKWAVLGTSTTMVGIDITGATLFTVELVDLIISGGAGSIGIKGDAASANITTGFIATVSSSSLAGVTTALSGITIDDIRWNFQGNGIIADSMPDGLVSLSLNATATTLSVGVPALVSGTWAVERTSQFTGTTGGRLTYNGERDLVTPIDIAAVCNPASGTNKSIRLYAAINGVEIPISGKAVNISSGDPKEITILWQEKLSENDYVEVFIENETDGVSVTIVDAVLRVR